MHTLKQLADTLKEIPASAAWYLSDISEFKGKQELYTRQSPQKLKALREHALIESAVSSNRIEGVEIDRKRIGTAYGEFSTRVDKTGMPKGDKTATVIEQIRKIPSGFSLSQLQDKCPDVSYDMIRKILKDLKSEGRIIAKGRGLSALWHKKGNTLL